MRYAHMKPISYLKAHAPEILDNLEEPMVITQRGEAKAVLMDVTAYEQSQETAALLKLLVLGVHDVEAGRVTPARETLKALRKRGRERSGEI